ncbi:tetratricopeptide repeat protein [Cyanobacterium stanieri LEGE 03274]|uniref:Tetratricopeptide repeat protein n=1 Tax=Cyanobacterium stanieri LEGE 03274 TaxID=1828756 RepID=A0ABR9V742_9CHRO|nr:tetratricopeptide repeat protein [Cyanobacterium stanieri]MBE9222649.1 tetratricopeptide repeat protein [Cyanobacterium stanieri LEGE 03274]
MNENLPVVYISILLGILSIVAVLLLRQIIKTRKVENRFSTLQKKLTKERGTAEEYYELASIYLDKKLYVQAVQLLQRALKASDDIEAENKALIYNALGFAHFSQEQYDIAIRNYKEAIKLYPEYAIALNNLGNVYEKKQLTAQALEVYKEVLTIDAKNSVAKRRVESLEKRFVTS